MSNCFFLSFFFILLRAFFQLSQNCPKMSFHSPFWFRFNWYHILLTTVLPTWLILVLSYSFPFFNISLLLIVSPLCHAKMKVVLIIILLFIISRCHLFVIGEPRLETNERDRLVGLVGLYILHYHLFHVVDKKTFKLIWELHKKVMEMMSKQLYLAKWWFCVYVMTCVGCVRRRRHPSQSKQLIYLANALT